MFSGLVEFARAAGIERFTVSMQADNTPAIALFRRFNGSGATLSQGILESTVHLAAAVAVMVSSSASRTRDQHVPTYCR